MLSEEYKNVIRDLINATSQLKVIWFRGSSPNTFVAEPSHKSKVLIDTYYSQADQSITSCINLTLFEKPSGKLIDEIVICDQDKQSQDYELLKALYLTARKQFADQGINPLLTEISASIK